MNMHESDTLSEMRSQLQLLHHKIDNSNVITEKLLRKTMRTNVGRVNRTAKWISIIALLSIPYTFWAFNMIHMSMAFTIVTCLYFAVAIVYTLLTHHGIRTSVIAQCSLKEVNERVLRFRLFYIRWLYFALPFILGWFAWFAYEVMTLIPVEHEQQRISMLIGACVGGLAGGIIGVRKFLQTLRLTKEVLSDIKDFKAMEQADAEL